MTIVKPVHPNDLEPPFERIGDEEWDVGFRRLLEEYGVPLPSPTPEVRVGELEQALGFSLDSDLRTFLRSIGPVDFRSWKILPLEEIRPATDVWFAEQLAVEDQARLPQLLCVLDYLGTGDFVTWDVTNGGYWLVGHDPAGISPWSKTFSDCIREQCVDLAVGYYGWPEKEVEMLVDAVKKHLFER